MLAEGAGRIGIALSPGDSRPLVIVFLREGLLPDGVAFGANGRPSGRHPLGLALCLFPVERTPPAPSSTASRIPCPEFGISEASCAMIG